MKAARSLAACALLIAAGCRAATQAQGPPTAWSVAPRGVDPTWRDLRLFEGRCALVLASSVEAAAQAHELARVAYDAFEGELRRRPSRGLLIAVSSGDPLLLERAEEMLERVPRWNAEVVGREPPPSRASATARRGDEQVAPELAARVLTAGIPKDEPALGLDATLREQIAYVVVLPTDTCLEATCSEIVRQALERQGVSWLQRRLIRAVAGDPAAMLASRLRASSLAMLLDVWLAVDRVPAPAAVAVLARAGVAGVLPERPSGDGDRLARSPPDEGGR